jgi:hypothetical protein
MQAGASFNVGDLKEKVQQAIAASKVANQQAEFRTSRETYSPASEMATGER